MQEQTSLCECFKTIDLAVCQDACDNFAAIGIVNDAGQCVCSDGSDVDEDVCEISCEDVGLEGVIDNDGVCACQ